MEREPDHPIYNRLQVLDDLINHQILNERFERAISDAVDASETLPANEQFQELLAIHDKAYHMEYRLRAGVQSNILDKVMEIPEVSASVPLLLELHLMQVESLTQDIAILRAGYYSAQELENRIPGTVAKLHHHGNAALDIMKHRPYRKHHGKAKCKAVLHMVPLDYRLT